MNEILENGTQVLIFKQTKGASPNILNFLKGIIIQYDVNNNLYTIKDENNVIYYAKHGYILDGFFILTIDDYIKKIKITIKENKETISNLNYYNYKLNNILHVLLEDNNYKKK